VPSGEDVNEELFAVTDERFLNSAEALRVDLLGLRVKTTRTVSMSAGVGPLAARGHCFSNTEPLNLMCG